MHKSKIFSNFQRKAHSSSMSHSSQAANQIKQEAGFTTLPLLPVLMPVDVVGTIDISYTCICVYRNGGTMANADERLILAVFNYDELYN